MTSSLRRATSSSTDENILPQSAAAKLCDELGAPPELRAVVVGNRRGLDEAFERVIALHNPDAQKPTSYTVAMGYLGGASSSSAGVPVDRVGVGIAHYAALAGNVAWLNRCRTCEAAWTPHGVDGGGGGATIAHYAAAGGSVEAMQWIALTLGDAFLCLFDARGDTAATVAAREGHVDVLSWLDGRLGLEVISAAGSSKGSRKTPMHVAAEYGQVAVLRYFVERLGVDEALASTNAHGLIPMTCGAAAGRLNVIEYIHNGYVRDDAAAAKRIGLLAGSQRDGGMTPIHFAASNNHLSILRYAVVCYGRSVLLPTCRNGGNVAHFAAANGHVDVLEYIAGFPADDNIYRLLRTQTLPPSQRSPVSLAVQHGHVDAVRCLVRRTGRTAVATDGDTNRTPLPHLAARFGHGAVLAVLERELGDGLLRFTTCATTGRTAFEEALHYGQVDPVAYCVDTRSPPRHAARTAARRAGDGRMHMLRLLLKPDASSSSWK